MIESLFRIRRLIPAAILYAAGGVLGLGAVILLLLPGGFSGLIYEMYDSGITETSAVFTWAVIHAGLIIVTFGSACAMAVGLLVEVRSKSDGFDILYRVSQVQIWISRITGAVALVVMIVRAVRYLVLCPWMDTGIYDAYVMIIPEGVMVAQAVGLYCLLQRFLNGLCDAFASMAYVRLSKKLDDRPISGFCGTGLLVLAGVCAYLLLSRGGLLTAGMYGCVALGNLLLGLYLLRYKKEMSDLAFQSVKG